MGNAAWIVLVLRLPWENRAMARRPSDITIPNVRLGLDDLLAVIHSLDQPSRARVARALVEAEMDARFRELIEQMAALAPAEDITDADIDREVQAVRKAARRA
jgi:hypothetical protein